MKKIRGAPTRLDAPRLALGVGRREPLQSETRTARSPWPGSTRETVPFDARSLCVWAVARCLVLRLPLPPGRPCESGGRAGPFPARAVRQPQDVAYAARPMVHTRLAALAAFALVGACRSPSAPPETPVAAVPSASASASAKAWVPPPLPPRQRSCDVVFALDVSGSMQAVVDAAPAPRRERKGRPTRLEVAKDVIATVIEHRPGDRVGVVVFAAEAFVLSPLTHDHAAATALVDKIQMGAIDPAGTALGDGVASAAAMLRRAEGAGKGIVLVTDGDPGDRGMSLEHAARLANMVEAHVFAIQISDGGDADVQDGKDVFGNPVYARRTFKSEPRVLKQLASDAKGEYLLVDGQESFAKAPELLRFL